MCVCVNDSKCPCRFLTLSDSYFFLFPNFSFRSGVSVCVCVGSFYLLLRSGTLTSLIYCYLREYGDGRVAQRIAIFGVVPVDKKKRGMFLSFIIIIIIFVFAPTGRRAKGNATGGGTARQRP